MCRSAMRKRTLLERKPPFRGFFLWGRGESRQATQATLYFARLSRFYLFIPLSMMYDDISNNLAEISKKRTMLESKTVDGGGSFDT